jgi:glutaminyl-peptide cyclotransferase
MRTQYHKYIISCSVLLLLTWAVSCSGRPDKKTETTAVSSPAVIVEAVKLIKMISPEENTEFKLKDKIKVVLASDRNKQPDSVLVYFDSRFITAITKSPWECSIPDVNTLTTGRKSLKVTSFAGGKAQNTVTRFVIIYSNTAPVRYGYRVVNTYPHNRDAFTQGLVYDNGLLYEGTGQQTGSSLREVELNTGKVIRQHNIDASLFGEGITLYRDRIYQVTWENKVGFVYDKATFNQISKIYYGTQGWGLTTIDDRIVMSDGTNVLCFYEPESYTVVSRIEVYDDKEKVDSLNELEYINGEIWANIWMSDLIARIDPRSGKVLGYINLKGILPESDRQSDTDVLNGIAYDKEGGRIFVTGKKWPKLFEIKVIQ